MQGIARIGDLVKIDTIPDDKARAQYQRSYLGQLYDAFGWAAVRQGEYPEASTALHHAYSLDPYSIQAMQDLGRYSEHMKNIPDAETWYIRCATTPTLSVNPCAGSLSQLYRRSHGNMEGFDSHLVELSSRMALERRSRIEKTEIIRGPPVSFNLTDIHGIKYSSSDYRGKIVVLSFWALWCDICRVHLPKLNRLAGPYRANSDVVILTINDGSDLPEARKWAELQGITLPILDGKDFIKKQGIASVPTTWFLDKEGRKVLEVVGLEASMDDEFNARIDMLRSEGRTAGPDMVR
jgi:thiol-disulfide isomerase/thioredoxin